MNNDLNFCELAKAVIEEEGKAVLDLVNRIDHNFHKACEILLSCSGRIVVTGMGKSGHIAKKIAATLSSTGSPAFSLHPGEASHGDMGMLTKNDVVIALSNSGTTSEVISIITPIKRLGIPLISLTGNPKSQLAINSTIHIDVSVTKEACPLGLAPTSSTTATLAMGDALAISLLQARGFSEHDFAKSHPGGRLGRKLLLMVDDIMHKDSLMPTVTPDTLLREALIEITEKKLGFTAIVNKDRQIEGIFTDGDLRRTLDKQVDIQTTPIKHVMTKECQTIPPHTLAAEALKMMEEHKINALMIADNEQKLLGVINMHHLLQAGVL